MSAVNRAEILIIEDDEDIREMLQECLEQSGYRVRVAGDGLAALEILEAGAPLPKLILLDLRMPRMDGWEFLRVRSGREALQRIPVIVLSATLDERSEPLPVEACLPKPISIPDLLEQVEALLRTFPFPAR